MKLYYSPGACSLSPHIVLREAGLPFELVRVNTKTHQLNGGADFYAINPKGYVPVLELTDGQRLTEGPVIVQYIADQVPQAQLAGGAAGSMPRYRVMEWLNFITSEIHKGFSPLFGSGSDEVKAYAKERLLGRLAWTDSQLDGKDHLLGAPFTVADAYLFTVASWCQYVQIDTKPWPHLSAFMRRVALRPAVDAALAAEGLKK